MKFCYGVYQPVIDKDIEPDEERLDALDKGEAISDWDSGQDCFADTEEYVLTSWCYGVWN